MEKSGRPILTLSPLCGKEAFGLASNAANSMAAANNIPERLQRTGK
jgi:hypothetical protein